MYRGNSRRSTGKLLLFLLCGIIIGTLTGKILADYISHPIFLNTVTLGTPKPLELDLAIMSVVFGLNLRINLGTVAGVIIGLILYFRTR
ncbi:MAG TPA: DUF4321 domain-containing protein [Candidatus Atribacteria bacterium]|nr:DUF4321 domain-containing protein [Candidatus Atribacteria bacterium]HPT77647.1 DUF4321 domain-containing protein [Candidatus Atribacteria bacterium]